MIVYDKRLYACKVCNVIVVQLSLPLTNLLHLSLICHSFFSVIHGSYIISIPVIFLSSSNWVPFVPHLHITFVFTVLKVKSFISFFISFYCVLLLIRSFRQHIFCLPFFFISFKVLIASVESFLFYFILHLLPLFSAFDSIISSTRILFCRSFCSCHSHDTTALS